MRFDPVERLTGALDAPADKSISHRAALLGAMATGRSVVTGYLRAADTDATLRVISQLGATVDVDGDRVVIEGVGLRGPLPQRSPLTVDNSGTLMRLLAGWLSGQPDVVWTIDGDASIRRRPIDRIAEPLGRMGASISSESGTAPFEIHGAALQGIDYRLPVPSAQVKSAVLIAGLLAEGSTSVTESIPSRDHTERMLVEQGVPIELSMDEQGTTTRVSTVRELAPVDREVPGDPSSAAFPLVAALLVEGSHVTVGNVCLNPGRTGFLSILSRMGARLSWEGGEIADAPSGPGPQAQGPVTAEHSTLTSTVVGEREVPGAIDELPLIALAACFAEGTTQVTGAGELKVKETDRIETVVSGLRGLGASVEALDDGFVVEGTGGLKGGRIESHGDHRIAMMGALAGMASEEGVEVGGFDAVSVSWPGFERQIRSLAGGR